MQEEFSILTALSLISLFIIYHNQFMLREKVAYTSS